MLYRTPRGTQDILPAEQAAWRFVQERGHAVAERFGYRRIDTPSFEMAGLFVRSVGAGTDIVEKEMYTFQDRGGEEMTLRAEGTAPVCRAYLEHGMHTLPQPVRLYYICPIFRYERPQAGRFRQHHQFGIEAIGDGDPAVDAEVIELGWRFLTDTAIGLGLQRLALIINSIGDRHCRPAYLDALKAYYQSHLDQVCPECRMRFERNPLRMLDCKRTDFACQPIGDAAPKSSEMLCAECASHWEQLRSYLKALDIPFQVDHRLVRGLDYYTRTVFEIEPEGARGQSTLLGGGRYDGLIAELGGKPTPGIGFGSGIERLALNLKAQEIAVPKGSEASTVVAYIGEEAKAEALRLASLLRRRGVGAVLAPAGRALKGQMRYATALGAAYVVILGEEELHKGTVQVKDLRSGEQREVARDGLATPDLLG
ncbi:MAG: histidine--tRNA ligase [Chloroflexi bacterium]|nr:histidine--tRNA ligase [Chloroflexota bacterium]